MTPAYQLQSFSVTVRQCPALAKRLLGIALLSLLTLTGVRQANAQIASDVLPSRQAIIDKGIFVNDFWIANNGLGDAGWSNATYYTGNQRLYEITGDVAYLNRAVNWATARDWLRATKAKYNGNVANNDKDPDNHCCGQTYIDLYQINPQPIRIADIVRAEDYIVSQPNPNFMSWIDTFYMQAPTLAKLSTLTGNPAYSETLWTMYNDTKVARNLYDTAEGLWYRDDKYFYPAKQTSGGNKVFWARGNGWMIAGLCRVIDALPPGAPHRSDYIAMLQTMAAALAPLQQADGFWRSSLYEPTQFNTPETSGTSFYAYAMAWAVNNGYLDRGTYLPIVAKAWNGLITQAVHPDGFLGYVQLVAAEPGLSFYNDTAPYGVGAFLLAASELSILADTVIAADAGADQIVYDFDASGSEMVTLDGSATHDPENKVVAYDWFQGASLIASGISANVNLGLGIHDITLRVTDDDTNTWEDTVRITVSAPAPERIYLETFDNPSGDALLGNYGWSVLVTENGNISSYSGESRALGVAAGDYAFYAPKQDDGAPWNDAVPNDPALASTTVPGPLDIRALSSINWLSSADNSDHVFRVAIQIGGVWYASNPGLNDGEPDSGTTVDIPLSYAPPSFATAANWRAIENATIGDPDPLSLGSAPASDLTGMVTAIGLYLVSGTNNEANGDHVRFDNFEVWVEPVPADLQPFITSFTSVGGQSWELTLSANPNTGYQFHSSVDLTFNPGTLVTTLSQANPAGDPGTVTGGNTLTTDGTGHGKVRLVLTGDPADFVRARSVP